MTTDEIALKERVLYYLNNSQDALIFKKIERIISFQESKALTENDVRGYLTESLKAIEYGNVIEHEDFKNTMLQWKKTKSLR